jgi:hypothetical protein
LCLYNHFNRVQYKRYDIDCLPFDAFDLDKLGVSDTGDKNRCSLNQRSRQRLISVLAVDYSRLGSIAKELLNLLFLHLLISGDPIDQRIAMKAPVPAHLLGWDLAQLGQFVDRRVVGNS